MKIKTKEKKPIMTKEQKEYIRQADDNINFLENKLQEMGFYGEEKEQIEKAIYQLKDFITWSLNNIRN